MRHPKGEHDGEKTTYILFRRSFPRRRAARRSGVSKVASQVTDSLNELSASHVSLGGAAFTAPRRHRCNTPHAHQQHQQGCE